MTSELLTVLALVVAVVAARDTLRRRVVFLLGRHGHELAPTVLLSFWLCGLLAGEVTGSVTGMAWVGAAVLVVVALLVRQRYAPLSARHRIWTGIDWGLFLYIAAIFWFIDLWDFGCHRAVAAQYLQGNIPPTALNDPRFPLTYHSIYDAMVAITLRAFPIEADTGMAVVSIFCLSLTLSNLRAVTRLIFKSPLVAQLARVLFVWGYGPVFIRYFLEHRDVDALHGRTSQVFADIILRRPAGLGFAFFTLALALILPCYRSEPGEPIERARRAVRHLIFLVPACVLLPQMAEEASLYVFVLFLPLLLTRRLPWRLFAALGIGAAIGTVRSGVFMSALMGYGAMAVPKPHFSWPPMLPSWSNANDGIGLFSHDGLIFFGVELGPVFFASLILALGSRLPRRRLLVLSLAVGASLALFIKPAGWPKSDLDRFLFYGTPPIFMLSAAIIESLAGRGRLLADRRWLVAVAALFAVAVCLPTVFWPTSYAARQLENGIQRHRLGGDLRRNLAAAGPRESILTTPDRVDDLVMAGFNVLAPFEGNHVGEFTRENFDAYVRRNADRAVWWFLPQNDPRVQGKQVEGKDGDYVLVRAPQPPGKS